MYVHGRHPVLLVPSSDCLAIPGELPVCSFVSLPRVSPPLPVKSHFFVQPPPDKKSYSRLGLAVEWTDGCYKEALLPTTSLA